MSQPTLLLLTIVGVLIALSLLGLPLVLRRRARVIAWVQALFRRPPEAGKPPGPRHYYKPYWS